MNLVDVTEQTFLLFAAKYYDASQSFDDTEFVEDIQRIKYIKRLLKKYVESNDLKERLILNHVIILYNMFGPYATVRLLFLKLQGYESVLKPFLTYISIMPEEIHNLGSAKRSIYNKAIQEDRYITERLKAL